ncbi:MAG: RNA methyltransferase [Nonlabens sp.]
MKIISSIHNPIIRFAEQLQRKSKARKQEGLFMVEGRREVELALKSGFQFTKLLFCPEIIGSSHAIDIDTWLNEIGENQNTELIEVSKEVYEKLAYRGGTEGAIAFAKAKSHQLSNLNLKDKPLVLVAEAIEKPGNLGALLRTADAAGVDALILSDSIVDLYNPNVVRSSVGGVFTVPIATASSYETITFLKNNQIAIYAATLQDSTPYTKHKFTEASSIVVGAESSGVSSAIRQAANANILIPMRGAIDSMNVSVSASILIFEAVRQRSIEY